MYRCPRAMSTPDDPQDRGSPWAPCSRSPSRPVVAASRARPCPANPDLSVQALDIKFDKPAYTAPAGDVEVAYVTKGQQVHSMVLEDANGDRIPDFRLQVAPGKSVGGSVDLRGRHLHADLRHPRPQAAGMVVRARRGLMAVRP